MPEINPPEPLPVSTSSASGDSSANWAQKGIGKRWQQRFFDWLIRFGGKQRGYHMALIVTFWYVLFYPSIRRRCRYYLERRFPQWRGFLRRFLDAHRLVRTYAMTLVDMRVLEILGAKALSANSPDHARLIELAAGDRGFVLIHAHVGCWRVGMSTLGTFPKRVSIVTLPEPEIRTLVDGKSMDTIDPRQGTQSAMQMTEALLAGGILVMMGDRTFGPDKNVAAAKFLGGEVLLPVTPYRLASATGMPVVVMTAPRIKSGKYELRLAKVIEVPPGLGRNPQNYTPYVQMFADCMEEFVRDFPWQFFNFYDFWRETGSDA